MSRSLKVRKPRPAEIGQLLPLVEEPLETPSQRRAQAILLHNDGMNATEIAATLEVHVNTIYADLHAFDQQGIAAIHQIRTPGAPAQLTEEQKAEICRIADQSPQEVGLSFGRWSLSTLRTYLIRQGIVKKISGKHLGRILKKGGSVSAEYDAS
jgi:transposase